MHTNEKKIAIINSAAPFSRADGKESLDAALIYGSYEQPVSLFFQGDGVWQLVNKQQPDQISIKDYLKTFAALPFYDIDNVYVCSDSLHERGLTEDFHLDNAQVLTKRSFTDALRQHDIILRF